MRIRVVAVGTRMPAWVQHAVDEYGGRLPRELSLEWREVRAEARGAGATPAVWMAREAQRIRDALPVPARVVSLDEHGDDVDTRGFAARLAAWRDSGQPVAILVGGPDGLDPGLKRASDERIRLSSLTLPHPLVRVVLAEQIFRAWSVLSNHPYHRD